MLITTTNTLQGKEIVEYLGVASGQAIMGANVVRDFLA
ncbi:MAG: heavy metal-binding domain-containing protein, partial [Planifilum sp.]